MLTLYYVIASNCAEAGKLNCNISRIDPVELCDVQMPNNMYCYCNEMCTEDCCPDSVTVSTAGLSRCYLLA